MPELLDEDLLSTSATSRYLNERVPDKHFSPLVVWRWTHDGLVAADGQRVFLEHVRLGRRLVTSKQALARFARRLAQRGTSAEAPLPAAADAKAQLAASGFFA